MVGKEISHYKIIEKLGEGGMGVVYKAQDLKLNRPVSLKFLTQQSTSEDDAVKRFINEAQTASALDHANVCTIYEIDETEDGQLFIAMAFYDGETLKQKIDKGPLSVDDTIDIAEQIAQGLLRAHEAGIVHRDIKPENVIVTNQGDVKILDFGLAKLSSHSPLTIAGTILGTMSYMSPEQINGHDVDHRTDIWSLGVVIYEMLTGKLPFEGEYTQAIIYTILNEEPEEFHSIRSELSSNFQIVLERALEKDSADRYKSVREMISGLKELSDTSGTETEIEAAKPESDKVSYLNDYSNDIFLSYAHIDDKSLTEGQKGWISKFHMALQIRLEQLLGADTRISLDDAVKRKGPRKKVAKTSFQKAAIMVSIVSPQYVKSAQCVQEVKKFCEIAEEDEGLWIEDKARIFKAVKTFVARDSQPEELQVIPDYEFYRFEPGSNRPQEFWPELGTEANKYFWTKLEDIAYDIYLLIETIKSKKADPGQIAESSPMPTVYLSETTYDLMSHRDRIKRQLQQRRVKILPDRPLPLNFEDLQKQVRVDLERCSLSIHLIGENYGVVPEGETRSIAEIQQHLAASNSHAEGLSQLIWMPPGLQTKDERQQRLVESLIKGETTRIGDELLQTSLDEFKTFIIDRLSEGRKEVSQRVVDDDILRIYLQCDKQDLDATAQLEEYLFDQGFEIKLPAFDGNETDVFEAHKENLLLCDATIIYYGNATDSWLSAKMADSQKIAGYGRSKPMKANAIYLATPETSHKQRFRTREAMIIKNFADFIPDLLTPFINALRNGKGEES